jgi:hypothetical protein
MARWTSEGCGLVDVERRHREYPESFEIPSEAERKAIQRGDKVKLVFRDRERMWLFVEVVAAWDDLFHVGRLSNQPVDPGLGGLRRGDFIEFQARHIAAIEKGEGHV